MKRIRSYFSVVCLVCVILTGCGHTDEPGASRSQNTQEMVTDTLSSEEMVTEISSEISEENSVKNQEETEKAPGENAATEEQKTEVSENENYYEVCSGFSKTEIEDYGKTVKASIMNRDWIGIADKISYPIRIGDREYTNEEEWKQIPFDEVFTEEFYQGLEAESCANMFCNYQGIMLGNGQVWIGEVLDANGENGKLKIIAVNP